jgi:hypothetical protein
MQMTCFAPSCLLPSINDSYHCEQHSSEARKLYLKYKAAEETIPITNLREYHSNSSIQDIIHHYARLARVYDMRRNYRMKFFKKEHWDKGHDNHMNNIIQAMLCCESLIAKLTLTTYNNEVDRDDPDDISIPSDIPDSFWDSIKEPIIRVKNRQILEENIWNTEIDTIYRNRMENIRRTKLYIDRLIEACPSIATHPARYAIYTLAMKIAIRYRCIVSTLDRWHAKNINVIECIKCDVHNAINDELWIQKAIVNDIENLEDITDYGVISPTFAKLILTVRYMVDKICLPTQSLKDSIYKDRISDTVHPKYYITIIVLCNDGPKITANYHKYDFLLYIDVFGMTIRYKQYKALGSERYIDNLRFRANSIDSDKTYQLSLLINDKIEQLIVLLFNTSQIIFKEGSNKCIHIRSSGNLIG